MQVPHYSPEQYLARERDALTKSEYLDGKIYAMAGASEAHNLIGTNLLREVSLQLKGRPCRTYPSDMRVEVGSNGLYLSRRYRRPRTAQVPIRYR